MLRRVRIMAEVKGDMTLITLTEYAERHGKFPSNLRRMVSQGRFKTAVKMGRDWFIDEDEPFIDGRITTGKYIGWRERHLNRSENNDE